MTVGKIHSNFMPAWYPFVQHCWCSDTVITPMSAVTTVDDKIATSGQKKSHATTGIFGASGFVAMGLFSGMLRTDDDIGVKVKFYL